MRKKYIFIGLLVTMMILLGFGGLALSYPLNTHESGEVINETPFQKEAKTKIAIDNYGRDIIVQK